MNRSFRLVFVSIFAILALACAGEPMAGDPGDPGKGDSAADGANPSGSDGATAPGSDGGTSSDSDGTGTGAVWHPTPGTRWQWQLTGTIDTDVDAAMFDIDLFEAPQDVIDLLHQQGRVVICYFSAGSFEDWREDASDFPEAALGNELDGWPGERWLDTRNAGVRSIMTDRLDRAVSKHCDGVEPDNVDGYTNDPGFSLTAATQLDYNRFLSDQAHVRGLSVGLKNDLDQVGELVERFDWALNEECMSFDECDALTPFLDAGKAVFHTEYASSSSLCASRPEGFSTIIKRLDLDAWRIACP